jgi:hypothetical protein
MSIYLLASSILLDIEYQDTLTLYSMSTTMKAQSKIEQQKGSETSSNLDDQKPQTSRAKERAFFALFPYQAGSLLIFDGPRVTNVEFHEDSGGPSVKGALSTTDFVERQRNWSVPPNIALANLPTYDASGAMNMKAEPHLRIDNKALEMFLSTYGPLSLKNDSGPSLFEERMASIAASQLLLRKAWPLLEASRSGVLDEAEKQMEDGFRINLFGAPHKGAGLYVMTSNLWKFILLLFFMDAMEDKTGICANPECVAPYFIKKRKTQIFCEAGPCVIYKQRKYALDYWNSKGNKHRLKQQRRKGKP